MINLKSFFTCTNVCKNSITWLCENLMLIKKHTQVSTGFPLYWSGRQQVLYKSRVVLICVRAVLSIFEAMNSYWSSYMMSVIWQSFLTELVFWDQCEACFILVVVVVVVVVLYCFALLGFAGIALPSDWAPMPRDPQTGSDSTVHLVDLIPSSPEYQGVVQKVQATGGNVNITRIQRVQNPHLYQTYMVKKQKMDKDHGGRNNERKLFHGTASANIIKINTQGFNRSFSGLAHGTQTWVTSFPFWFWLLVFSLYFCLSFLLSSFHSFILPSLLFNIFVSAMFKRLFVCDLCSITSACIPV